MKLIKIKDVVKDPSNPIMQGVLRNQLSKAGDELNCRKCDKKYTRGGWDFYSLCDECFAEFDKKKMEERFKMIKKLFNRNNIEENLCPDCGKPPLETKREKRDNGYSEEVSYCNCGNTYTSY